MMILRLVCAGLIWITVSGGAKGENWPQWRGARLDGVCHETGLPTEWSREKNVAWRAPLPGPAGATPVVWGKRIFLTSLDGADQTELALLCYDTGGRLLWKQTVGKGNRNSRGDEGNFASPSPSTDGQHVWCFFGSGDLACFDVEGREVWKRNLQQDLGKFDIQFGMSSTPVLDRGRLYLQLIHSGGARVVALDAATGKQIWNQPRPSDAVDECEHSYASPILYRDAQREFLLTHGADYIVGHALEDGRELWRCGGMNPKGRGRYNNTLRFVASPVAAEGLIVAPSAKNGPVLGLSPHAQGDITATESGHVWTMPQNTPDVPSPVIHEGWVYLCRENGNLIVLDAKTGVRQYENRTHPDRYRASPVVADGKVYLTSRDGTITVARTGKTFEKLAENVMGESISASPAISDGTIYLRTFDALYAIRAPR